MIVIIVVVCGDLLYRVQAPLLFFRALALVSYFGRIGPFDSGYLDVENKLVLAAGRQQLYLRVGRI